MDGMTISDAASATGFSASAIRYYERIGLLPEADRSDSGYRLYGEDAVERLHFIRRAKRLGLALDDISELVTYWSEGRCSITRERLQRLLAAKLKETWQRVDELHALGSQLEDAYKRLAGHPPQSVCGPECGCPPEIGEDEDLHHLVPFGSP